MKADNQRGGIYGTPLRPDSEIIDYCITFPDSSVDFIRRTFNCSFKRASALRSKARERIQQIPRTKKTGTVDWREAFTHSKNGQRLKNKASWSQDKAIINIQEKYKINTPIVVQFISDLHIGSIATNYDALREITDGVINTPNLFWILNGDLTETTVNFKNALSVHSQVLTPEMQHDVLESWLDCIAPKVLSAGWDNHGVEREEKWGAMSNIKRMLNRRFIYHNGMGEISIEHGKARYDLIVSHKVAGYSIFNQLHGAKRMMRLQFPRADIFVTGDKHTPDIETYYEGEYKRAAIMSGSFKIEDGYSKRYFSLYAHMDMPAIVLMPDKKYFSVHMNAMEALTVAKNMKERPRW